MKARTFWSVYLMFYLVNTEQIETDAGKEPEGIPVFCLHGLQYLSLRLSIHKIIAFSATMNFV